MAAATGTLFTSSRGALLLVLLLVVLAERVLGQVPEDGEQCLREPFRPQFHYSARREWLNDPNGLVFFAGEWHLFYQYNPTNPLPGNVSWGHAVSDDLVHWHELGVADEALRYSDDPVLQQKFSGSAVIDTHSTAGFGRDAMVAVFTNAVGPNNENQTQHLAFSTDRGRTFQRYSGNPVLDIGPNINWRDPKVQWYQPAGASSGTWLMAVALCDAHQIQFYSSPNLRDWTHLSDFGPAGATGGQWECPDLFELPVDGEDGVQDGVRRWVLIVSVNPGGLQGGSGTQYFLGDFNGTHFTADEGADDDIRWLDFGKDYYAAVSWNSVPDGGRYMIGWISNWRYAASTPTSPWRNALSVPRTMSLRRDADARIVLAQAPVVGLASLRRGAPTCAMPGRRVANATVPASTRSSRRLAGRAYVLEVDVVARGARRLGVRVRVGDRERREHTVIGYDTRDRQLYVDRTMSGRTNFSDEFAEVHRAPLHLRDSRLRMQVLVDWGSVEVFANDGEVVITDIIFPDDRSRGVDLFAEGGAAEFASVRMWQLASYRPCPDQGGDDTGSAGTSWASAFNPFGSAGWLGSILGGNRNNGDSSSCPAQA